MSDALSVAVYRAKIARKTPSVVNVWHGNGAMEQKLKDAESYILYLQQQNTELKGRVGGLTTQIVNLTSQKSIRNAECPSFPKISEIAEIVSREFRIALIDMQSERRSRDATIARQVAMYLARQLTNRSYPSIARFFGKRDHTTAMHAVSKIEKRLETDDTLRQTIARIKAVLIP